MDLLSAWHAASTANLPEVDVWDAHTHTGANDPDGVVGESTALLAALTDAGHRGAVVMSSQEPGGYPAANDRILSEAEASEGRLIPFCRVDPRTGPSAVAELDRCVDAGSRGLKLHPRGENFSLALPVVDDLAGVASEAGLPVLVHAGRGIPSLAGDALRLLDAHPGLDLILAHAGISDLARLTQAAPDHPGMFFDLAWWSTSSIRALVQTVPPHRLLYASDTPYGSPQMAGAVVARIALAAGWGVDAIRGVMGANLRFLLDGSRPPFAGDAAGPDGMGAGDSLLWAAYADFQAAIAQILAGSSGAEALQLAHRACLVTPDHPHAAAFRAVATTIDIADTATPDRITAVRAMIVASSALLTPDVPVPEL